MEYVKLLSENPAVITGLATLAALVIVWLLVKKPWIAKWMPLVFNVYNLVEKELPDSSGYEKLRAFMIKFQDEYKKRTGSALSETKVKEIEDAVAVVAFKGEHKE